MNRPEREPRRRMTGCSPISGAFSLPFCSSSRVLSCAFRTSNWVLPCCLIRFLKERLFFDSHGPQFSFGPARAYLAPMSFRAFEALSLSADIADEYFFLHSEAGTLSGITGADAASNSLARCSSSKVAMRTFSGRNRRTEPSRKVAVNQRPGERVSTEPIRQNSSLPGEAPLHFVSTMSLRRWAARYAAAASGMLSMWHTIGVLFLKASLNSQGGKSGKSTRRHSGQ
jgi:hypothetical protein